MEIVQGIAGELQPGPYVDCPEEGCVYTLEAGILTRRRRGADNVIEVDGTGVDPNLDVADHDRSRLRRIARILAQGSATARLASPFVIYVPRGGAVKVVGIRAGSGIVGAPLPGGDQVLVHYEGARFRQSGMARLADRVFHAHSRLVHDYPTSAMAALPREWLREVATYDPESGIITPIDASAEADLARWLGTEKLDRDELQRTGAAG